MVEFNFKDVKQFPLLKSIPLFYQNIFIAFNRAKNLNKPVTKQMFLEEIIWGNLHFTYFSKETKNREVLYFKNWIDAGLIYFNSLKFTEGQIDVEYIYSKIKDKRNIYSEIFYVKEALRPFSQLINTFQVETHDRLSREPGPLVNENHCKLKMMNNKQLYTSGNNKKIPPFQEHFWIRLFDDSNINYKALYTKKIKHIQDKQIAEFNYKIRNLILPYEKNLKKWGFASSDKCEICNVLYDIPHLLFFCKKANCFWRKVSTFLNINLTIKDIIISNMDQTTCLLISVIAFFIYKDWYINRGKDQWVNKNILQFVYSQTHTKVLTYKQLGKQWQSIRTILKNFEYHCQ